MLKEPDLLYEKNIKNLENGANKHVSDWIRQVNDQHLFNQYEVSDRIALRQGHPLHDKQDPEGDARKLASQWIHQQGVTSGPIKVMGLGLGFHVEALLELMPLEQQLHVQLIDRVMFQLALRNRDMEKIFTDPRVTFVGNLSPESAFVLPGYTTRNEVAPPQRTENTQDKNNLLANFYHFLKSVGFKPQHIVDIGANHGTWTRETLKYFPDAHYSLFEPQEWLKSSLQDILNQQPKVQFHAVGVGALEGSFQFSLVDRDDSCSFAYKDAAEQGHKQVEIPVVTLNHFLKESDLPDPDIIKVDAEGWDIEVLKGASDYLGRTEIFMVEVGVVSKTFDNSLVNMVNFMDQHGYRFFEITDLNRPFPNKVLWLMEAVFVKKEGTLDSKRYHEADS